MFSLISHIPKVVDINTRHAGANLVTFCIFFSKFRQTSLYKLRPWVAAYSFKLLQRIHVKCLCDTSTPPERRLTAQ